MNRAASLAVLLVAFGGVAFAQSPPAHQTPPPPQTPGALNSQAAKHPADGEALRPLARAAQASPRKHSPKDRHVQESKPNASGQKSAAEQKATAQEKPTAR